MEKRWQQIVYHIRQKGIQISDVDKPTHPDTVLPSHTNTEKVLKDFDKEIPFFWTYLIILFKELKRF